MRFTVRRPPNGEGSPCRHRPSGGDITCSVHVCIAPASRQASHSKTAWLLRFSGATCPQGGAPSRRERGRELLDPAGTLVLQPRDQRARAAPRGAPIEPRSPGTARLVGRRSRARSGSSPGRRGLRPGPHRSDATNRWWSSPPSPCADPTHGRRAARSPVLTRPADRPTSNERAATQHHQPLDSPRDRPGGSAVHRWRARPTPTPRSTPTTCSRPDRQPSRESRERDMPPTRPITGHPIRLDPGRHRPDQRNRTHPTFGTSTRPTAG